MKPYILSLLQKASSDEAKILCKLIFEYYRSLTYTEANSFECFYLHIPSDYSDYDFFHNCEGKGERNIEGTPIHWRVICYDKLQLWLQ